MCRSPSPFSTLPRIRLPISLRSHARISAILGMQPIALLTKFIWYQLCSVADHPPATNLMQWRTATLDMILGKKSSQAQTILNINHKQTVR